MRGGPAADDAGQPAHRRATGRPDAGGRGTRAVRLPTGTVDRGSDRGGTQRRADARCRLSEGAMKIIVNDKPVEVDDQTTVAGLIERLGFPGEGIGVGVGWGGLAGSDWQMTLTDGARLEVVTAVQGA